MPSGSLGKSITQRSTVETELSVGNVAFDENNIMYVKVKCKVSGGIATGEAVTMGSTTPETLRGFLITSVTTLVSEAGDKLVGWNLTGSTALNNEYFWAAVGPIIIGALCETGVLKQEPLFYSSSGKVTSLGTGQASPIGTAIGAESGVPGLPHHPCHEPS